MRKRVGSGCWLAAMLLIAIAAWGSGIIAAQLRTGEERITVDELKKLVADDAVLVVDVRGLDSYKLGHIPGSIVVPLDKVEERAAELKKAAKPIVTYCSWPAEHTSARAAQMLQGLGVTNVRALLGGFAAWVNAGQTVVTGEKPK